MNILPFSYAEFDKKIVSHKFISEFLLLHPNDEVSFDLNTIMNVECTYKPVWGIKIDLSGRAEYEAYFYQCNPYTGKLFSDDDDNCGINFKKLTEIFVIPDSTYSPISEHKTCLLYSCDIGKPVKHFNQYFLAEKINGYKHYYSILNNKVHNHYYSGGMTRYGYKEYIDPYYINTHKSKAGSLSIANKIVRNYIGVYYDGVSCEQLKKLLTDFNVNIPFIDKYKDDYFSISLDYDKITDKLVRIGIYGILY